MNASRLVCVECRAVMTAPGPLPHRLLSLDDARERAQLVTAVWGPRTRLRREIVERTRRPHIHGRGGVGLAGLVVSALLPPRDRDDGTWTWDARGSRREATGATSGCACAPPVARGGVSVSGRVADAALEAEPWTGRRCVAYGAVLDLGGSRMLRDAATTGFDLVPTSGPRVHVPAGPCELEMGGALRRTPDRGRIDAALAAIDPARDDGDLDPFPYDHVALLAIRPGDEVELFGRLATVRDPDAPDAGYRDAPATLVVPDGPVRLRLVAARRIEA